VLELLIEKSVKYNTVGRTPHKPTNSNYQIHNQPLTPKKLLKGKLSYIEFLK